jgi:hypothetical protein
VNRDCFVCVCVFVRWGRQGEGGKSGMWWCEDVVCSCEVLVLGEGDGKG